MKQQQFLPFDLEVVYNYILFSDCFLFKALHDNDITLGGTCEHSFIYIYIKTKTLCRFFDADVNFGFKKRSLKKSIKNKFISGKETYFRRKTNVHLNDSKASCIVKCC